MISCSVCPLLCMLPFKHKTQGTQDHSLLHQQPSADISIPDRQFLTNPMKNNGYGTTQSKLPHCRKDPNTIAFPQAFKTIVPPP